MDVNERIDQIANEELDALGAEEESVSQPVDFYQAKKNDRRERAKKAPSFGAPASMTQVVRAMCNNIEPSYNVTINQYNHLREYGMDADAQAMLDSYMENDFLPLVMGVVDQYGVDALMTNRQVIDMLDEKALTGNGDGTGYTVAFVQAMAPEVQGTVASVSDMEVQAGIEQMKQLAAHGNNAGAVSLARSLKEKVDNGQISASQDDYKMLALITAKSVNK